MKYRNCNLRHLGQAVLVTGLTITGPALADAGHGPSGIWVNLVHLLGGSFHIIDLAGVMLGAAALVLAARVLKRKVNQPARIRPQP